MKLCQYCGTQNENGGSFCSSCGERLAAPQMSEGNLYIGVAFLPLSASYIFLSVSTTGTQSNGSMLYQAKNTCCSFNIAFGILFVLEAVIYVVKLGSANAE